MTTRNAPNQKLNQPKKSLPHNIILFHNMTNFTIKIRENQAIETVLHLDHDNIHDRILRFKADINLEIEIYRGKI